MLVASRLILVSILASSWSLFDHDRTNVRPTSVPKSWVCPSVFGGDAASSVYRAGASAFLFSKGQSCLTCRVVGTTRPVPRGLDFGVEGRSPRKLHPASSPSEARVCTHRMSACVNSLFYAICACRESVMFHKFTRRISVMRKDKKHAGRRPASSERNRKSSTVKIRVTDFEAAAIRSKANQWGLTVSQYLRDAALNREMRKMIITNNSDLNLLTAEVNKVGINLNQIARRLNASASYRECFGVSSMREGEVLAELKDLQSKFASIDRQLLEAREEFSREQTDKIFDYEDYLRAKEFWLPGEGGETYGDDVHPSA